VACHYGTLRGNTCPICEFVSATRRKGLGWKGVVSTDRELPTHDNLRVELFCSRGLISSFILQQHRNEEHRRERGEQLRRMIDFVTMIGLPLAHILL
jgi:hypothetical protein